MPENLWSRDHCGVSQPHRRSEPHVAFDASSYAACIRTERCFICRIVAGEPTGFREHVIFQGDSVIAFLAQPPVQRGYVLVAPTRHHVDVVADFSLEEYLALQAFIHRMGRAVSAVLPVERLYLLSLGSKQGIAHVHWHVVPLPPEVPFDQQQLQAVTLGAGYLELDPEEQSAIASSITAALLGLSPDPQGREAQESR
jgi:diadenosine tetraphosphate (Ap4A) HIT family hydrolase